MQIFKFTVILIKVLFIAANTKPPFKTNEKTYLSKIDNYQFDSINSIIDIKNSLFISSFFFKELPLSFQPEEISYYSKINNFSLLFVVISLGLAALIGIYIYFNFNNSIDYKGSDENKIDYTYKLITWVLYSISALSAVTLLILIIIFLTYSHIGLVSSFPGALQKEIDNEKGYLSQLISLNSFLQSNSIIIKSQIIDLASAIRDDLLHNESNILEYKSFIIKELVANLLLIFLVLCSYGLIAIAYRKRSLKITKSSLFFTACLIILLPLIQIFNFKLWFFNIDFCDANNQAIYYNKQPAFNKALGYFFNCHNGELREKINNLNSELETIYSSINDPNLYEPILLYKAASIDMILSCDMMFNSFIITESQLCSTVIMNYDYMNIFVLLLFFPLLTLFWVNKRLYDIVKYTLYEEGKYQMVNN